MASIAPEMGTDATIAVSLLGGFHLWYAGRPLPGVPRASQRLLAFLALHAHVANRATIAGTLWPDTTDGTPTRIYARRAPLRLQPGASTP